VKQRYIGLLIQHGSPLHRKILESIIRHAQACKDWILIDASPGGVPYLSAVFHQCHGIISTVDSASSASFWRSVPIPWVGIGGHHGGFPSRPGCAVIESDNSLIGQRAAEYLFQLGYRRFGYYSSQPRTKTQDWARERWQAFSSFASARGCAIYHAPFGATAMAASSVLTRVRRLAGWLAQLPHPVAILGANDYRAWQVLEACRLAGLRVPRQVAIMGVDNDEVLCTSNHPPLSSVIQDTDAIGRTAVTLLARLLDGERRIPASIRIPPAGIAIRQSTDIAAVAHPTIMAVIEHIQTHLCEPMTAESVAQSIGRARSTLDHLARRLTGQSIHQMIAQRRLLKAMMLFGEKAMPLKSAAHAAGFTSPQYLARVFRRELHMTPHQYHRRIKGGSLKQGRSSGKAG